jgi:hypothetical protein
VGAVASIFRSLAVTIVLFAIFDVIFDLTFPHFERLRYNFSAAYLSREARALANTAPIIVLGDSVLWGFGVRESQTAVSLLHDRDPRWHNLAYAGGGPVNTLAMLRFLLHAGIRPQLVVFNVNEKQFNVEDSAYQRLHPAVEEVAWADLDQAERAPLVHVLASTTDARIDRMLSHLWHFYGMRADVKDVLFNDTDLAHEVEGSIERLSGAAADLDAAHRPTPEKFEGTYDLAPIAKDNISFNALLQIGTLLRHERLPALAILTPTNHRLLHEFIDDPEYGRNVAKVRDSLRGDGIRVLDVDAAFPADDFIDNDHLTVAGNRKLAELIERFQNT